MRANRSIASRPRRYTRPGARASGARLEVPSQPPELGEEALVERRPEVGDPDDPPVPRFAPISRSTISTCSERHRATFSSWSSRASETANSSPCARAIATSDSARRASSSAGMGCPCASRSEQNPSQRVGSSRRRSSRPSSSGEVARSCRNPGSFSPLMNSISRNCADWNPEAGARRSRNERKSCGDIVSRTSMCSISTRSIAWTRVRKCRARSVSWAKNRSRTDSSSNSICLNQSSYA